MNQQTKHENINKFQLHCNLDGAGIQFTLMIITIFYLFILESIVTRCALSKPITLSYSI
uniref:GH18372p n=1 Tax=Drosophila melanogaster TaxID=7227 RepID=Q95T63_DROME|nr:GH18372p [Drosophila melanogaster]